MLEFGMSVKLALAGSVMIDDSVGATITGTIGNAAGTTGTTGAALLTILAATCRISPLDIRPPLAVPIKFDISSPRDSAKCLAAGNKRAE